MTNKIIDFNELQEKEYLSEKQKDRLKNYKFQYEYRQWVLIREIGIHL